MPLRVYVEGVLPYEAVTPSLPGVMVAVVMRQLAEEFGSEWYDVRHHVVEERILQVWFRTDTEMVKVADRLKNFYATGTDAHGEWEFSFDYRDVSG